MGAVVKVPWSNFLAHRIELFYRNRRIYCEIASRHERIHESGYSAHVLSQRHILLFEPGSPSAQHRAFHIPFDAREPLPARISFGPAISVAVSVGALGFWNGSFRALLCGSAKSQRVRQA